jgi:hypothetical protein
MKILSSILLVLLFSAPAMANENKYLKTVTEIQNPEFLEHMRCPDKFRQILSLFEDDIYSGNEFEIRRQKPLVAEARKKVKELTYACRGEAYLNEYSFKRQAFEIKPALQQGGCGAFGCTSPIFRFTDPSFDKPILLKVPESEAEAFKEKAKEFQGSGNLFLWVQYKVSAVSVDKTSPKCKARASVDCEYSEVVIKPLALEIRDRAGKVHFSKGKWARSE